MAALGRPYEFQKPLGRPHYGCKLPWPSTILEQLENPRPSLHDSPLEIASRRVFPSEDNSENSSLNLVEGPTTFSNQIGTLNREED